MKLAGPFRLSGRISLLVTCLTAPVFAQETEKTPRQGGELSYRLPSKPATDNASERPQQPAKLSADSAPAHVSPKTAPSAPFDHEAVFRAYAVYARSMRRQRLATGAGSLVAGAGLITTGALINDDSGWGAPLMLGGGIFAFTGALVMFIPSIAENNAEEHRVFGQGTHTSEQARALQDAWRKEAQFARRMRYIGSGLSYLVGVAEVSAGVAFAAGVGNFANDSDRAAMVGFWTTLGTLGLVAGTAGLIVRSPAEDSYESYRRTVAAKSEETALRLNFSVSPLVSGGMVGMVGSF